MIAYKVVRRGGWSLTLQRITGDCVVRYMIGVRSKPKLNCGPLCCFKSERAAREFVFLGGYIAKILRCRVTKSKLRSVWHDGGDRKPLWHLPVGTILCSSVTPLEVVK